MTRLQLEKLALKTTWEYVKQLEKNDHCEMVYYKNALTIRIVSKMEPRAVFLSLVIFLKTKRSLGMALLEEVQENQICYIS